MAAEKKKEVNPLAEAFNWDQRVKTELEAPHKWNEAWGSYFDNGVPLDYSKRIEYLEREVSKFPASDMHPFPYGVGKPFPQIDKDHRRRVFNPNPLENKKV